MVKQWPTSLLAGEGNGGKRKTSAKKLSIPGKLAPTWFKAIFSELNPVFRLSNDENRFHGKFFFPGCHGVYERKELWTTT